MPRRVIDMYVEDARPIDVPVRVKSSVTPIYIAAFFAAHIPMALLMKEYSTIAYVHALATTAAGFWFAVVNGRLDRVACVGAYIAGAEVLWRMSEAGVYWEFGKYAAVVIFVAAILRTRHFKSPLIPVVYFALLLPSVVLTVLELDWPKAQDEISFNLSGPFALMISGFFFANIRLSAVQLQRVFVALMAPIVGIAAVTLFAFQAASDVEFSGSSNLISSGGFGPNQVSGALGLGALLAFFFVLDASVSWMTRVLMLGGMLFLAVQSALTFSRSGLYNAAAGALAASFYLIRDRRSRIKFVVVGVVLFVAADYFLLPRLNELTHGALTARFENTDTTGRDEIALAHLEIWQENPIFGVGPGMAKSIVGKASHTELTRLVAEHGVFGFLALMMLFIGGLKRFRQARTPRNRALVVSLIGWSLLFMLNTGMRLAAPAFLFGLTFVTMPLPEPSRCPGGSNRSVSSLQAARSATRLN